MPHYFVGGINGVGKSTIVRELVAAEPSLEHIHTTSLIMQWLGIAPGDYEHLQSLPEAHKTEQNQLMLTHHLGVAGQQYRQLVLDSHYLHILEGRTSQLITGDWPRFLGALVLIEADVESIHERISCDSPTRRRPLFLPGTTAAQQIDALSDYKRETREEFEAIATRFSLPHHIIENNGDPATACNNLLAIHQELTGKS
ncbi:MAG TPA: hypothetical protein VLI54_00755 [Bacillota bacterium]|nr:hypothetical protein [Bacillota bacterium]